MNDYQNRKLLNENDVLDYFIDAIDYRNLHKDQSAAVAIDAFDKTHTPKLPFIPSKDVEQLRYEFGALEAPGDPIDDTQSLQDYDDELWNRLLDLVNKVKTLGTV